MRGSAARTGLSLAALAMLAVPLAAQLASSLDRDRGRTMLRVVWNQLRQDYYDSTFHGIDMAASVKRADSLIQIAPSNSVIFEIIARVLLPLDDSHTIFWPPERAAVVEYGWDLQMIGDSAFIVRVAHGSDAAAKGVKLGDRVLAVDGWVPNRRDLRLFRYYYDALNPKSTVRLVLQSPDLAPRVIDANSRIRDGVRLVELLGADRARTIREGEDDRRRWEDQFYRWDDELLIWRMGWFGGDERMDDGFARTRNVRTLILDLRGNPGGFERSWLRLAGHFVDRELHVGTLRRRQGDEPLIVRPRGKPFEGKVIVLLDSWSSSAAELFARFVQQTQRGLVLGDRSAGLVVRARAHRWFMGSDIVIPYGLFVTDADLVMADGVRLEKEGVMPDERILPTAADLAAGRDPVMARALALAGRPTDPTTAARLLPRDRRRP